MWPQQKRSSRLAAHHHERKPSNPATTLSASARCDRGPVAVRAVGEAPSGSQSDCVKVSRWLEPTVWPITRARRGATLAGPSHRISFSIVAPRRNRPAPPIRGLKSTATFNASLREARLPRPTFPGPRAVPARSAWPRIESLESRRDFLSASTHCDRGPVAVRAPDRTGRWPVPPGTHPDSPGSRGNGTGLVTSPAGKCSKKVRNVPDWSFLFLVGREVISAN